MEDMFRRVLDVRRLRCIFCTPYTSTENSRFLVILQITLNIRNALQDVGAVVRLAYL